RARGGDRPDAHPRRALERAGGGRPLRRAAGRGGPAHRPRLRKQPRGPARGAGGGGRAAPEATGRGRARDGPARARGGRGAAVDGTLQPAAVRCGGCAGAVRGGVLTRRTALTDHTRRTFLREASLGLAATTGGALLLRADAFPTRSTAEEVMAPPGVSPGALAVPPPASPLVPTRPVVAGP